ncbi:MAG: hypothetical protein ABSB15_14045 [Bryobacteraceae bacterium]
MNLWVLLNTSTLVVCMLIHAVGTLAGWDAMAVEEWTFAPVLIVSVIDIAEIINGREIFRAWLRQL